MPAGARVLEELGLDLRQFPAMSGVTYHVPGHGRAEGRFAPGCIGRGTRRVKFDEMLAEHARAASGVRTAFECEARSVRADDHGVTVETTGGQVRGRYLVGADGIRSRVARWMGWSRPPRSDRYALVSHLEAHGHGVDRVVVTLLDGCEVYLAPTGEGELLAAVLGPRRSLRHGNATVRESYSIRVAEAHPELAACQFSKIRGAGPFWVRPSTIASGRVFLLGDAAGFLDPLTGDGLTAGFLAARHLARLMVLEAEVDAKYRSWEARQWRRRVFMGRLALALSGTASLARRAIGGLARRPATLDRLLELNEGSRSPFSLSPKDWAALVGI